MPEFAAPAAANQSIRPSKVLVIGLNYAPDLIGVAKYTTEFAEWMAARGHKVRVVAGPPYYPAWRVERPYSGWVYSSETINDVEIVRTPVYVPRRPTGRKRAFHLGTYGAAVWPPAIWAALRFRPDLVFCIAPALSSAPAALAAAKISGAKSWLHVQDFEIDAAMGLGLMKESWVGDRLLGMERGLCSGFDRVSAISSEMCGALERKGVARNRIVEFRNWTDTDNIYPLPQSSPLRSEFGFSDSDVVVLYSGNLSEKQGVEILIDAARTLSGVSNIHFVICGQGPAQMALRAYAAGLERVVFLPLQPMERLNDLLNMADIHLLPQKAGVADLVMPSKLTNMLASGRPTIVTAEGNSGLAREMETCGRAVAPGDGNALAREIAQLAADRSERERLGRMARRRAEEGWAMGPILSNIEAGMISLLPKAPDAGKRIAGSLAANR